MQGYIKLFRTIKKKAYYKKSQYLHLWVHLLLSVNHKQKEFMADNKIILIKEGQILTGRKQLSRETGIPPTTIERILHFLENEHQIGQQKTTKYRIITIINWTNFQKRTEERTTSGQQADTNNNVNNDKNNIYIAKFKKINPTYEIIYKNKTERGALERLIKRFGWPEIEAKIDFLAKYKNDQYCPEAFTPYKMEVKWPQLEKFVLKKTREEREYRAQSSLVKRPVDPEGIKRIAEMKKGLSFKMPEENEE